MPETVRQNGAPRFADQFDMIDISRTVRPLIGARQRCGGVMFVETFAGNDGMFKISGERL